MFTSLQIALSVLILHAVYLIVMRLYFHPLKAFPGPRLAAMTNLYQAYWDTWRNGLFVRHLWLLHEIYGPVVRTGPNELHFNTTDAFFAIYPPHSGFTKDHRFYISFGEELSSFGLIDVQAHKQRKEVLSPLFSRRAILKLEFSVQQQVDLLVHQLRVNYARTRSPANLLSAFRCLALDVLTTYSFAHSFNGLTAPDFDHPILRFLQSAPQLVTAAMHFPLLRFLFHLPLKLALKLNPDISGLAQLRASLSQKIEAALKDPESLKSQEHETIFDHLIASTGKVLSKDDLLHEAQTLVIAGTEAPANVLIIAFFHLLDNPLLMKKLQTELDNAWPEKDTRFTYEMAEKLPYLTAIIKEGLRLSYGVSMPLPRVVSSDVVIDGHFVPAGTIVDVAQPFVLKNPEIFPDPDAFKPERWMHRDSNNLDRYLVAFSRGPRSCYGINLAWCELYLTFAHVARKFDMQLFETSKEDMLLRDHMTQVWVGKPLKAIISERP